MSKITEVVVYTLKPETKADEAFGVISEILNAFDGFESVERKQDINDPLTFIDQVTWRDQDSALGAQASIEKHPRFGEFAGMFKETKFFSHFKPLN